MTRSGLLKATLLIVAASGMAVGRRAEAQPPPGFQYAVKFVIGQSSGDILARGQYFTAINVHNPTQQPVTFRKKFVVALPGEKAGPVSQFVSAMLKADEALEIDTKDIATQVNPTGAGGFFKGFVVIESPVELDVVGVYTAAGSTGQVETMHMERVPPRKH
jgi:hypothetical protein